MVCFHYQFFKLYDKRLISRHEKEQGCPRMCIWKWGGGSWDTLKSLPGYHRIQPPHRLSETHQVESVGETLPRSTHRWRMTACKYKTQYRMLGKKILDYMLKRGRDRDKRVYMYVNVCVLPMNDAQVKTRGGL